MTNKFRVVACFHVHGEYISSEGTVIGYCCLSIIVYTLIFLYKKPIYKKLGLQRAKN